MQTTSSRSMIQVAELIASCAQVAPHVRVGSVSERLFEEPDLDALAVVDGEKPLGLITRTKLFFTLSRRFGNEIYSRQPIITIADTSPLIVADSELLDEVIEKAFARPPQNVYDEIVVTGADATYCGLLSVKRLVLEQSTALARSVLKEELATTRAAELDRMNRLKSMFLANVTHELRSPVNAIIGLAELLRMAADEGSMEQVRERLAFMISTATNLRKVITDILDLSKIEAGRMEVARQQVEVGLLLAEIAETTRLLVGEKPVTVSLDIPGDPVLVATDPIKLRQIVTNLASNAAKFTGSGFIEIRLEMLGEELAIRVRDSGVGIRAEDMDLIFSAFGQVEDAATKTHEGTGLGLTISRNLARLLGGTLSVASIFKEGSTFTLALPLRHPHQEGDCNAAQTDRDGHR